MASPKQSDATLLEALRAVALHGGINPASRATGIPQGTMRSRVTVARARGLTLGEPSAPAPVVLIPALPPPIGAVVVPSGFDEAWRVLRGQIGMAEDRYAGPSQRPRGMKHLVLSDLHAPFHDPALVVAAMAAHPDADTCIIAGDIGDGYGWSRFTKYETVPYEDEIAAVTAIMQMASERFRRVLVLDGNHDGPRLERQLRERLTPEMISAITYMTGGILSPIHALAKRFPNVEIVGHVTPDGRRLGWLYQHGDVVISHAEKFSITPGAAVRKIDEWLRDMEQHIGLKPWRVLIQAHTHASGQLPWSADKLLVETGCLARSMGYQLQAKIGGRPQRHGYTTFEQSNGHTDINSVRLVWFDACANALLAS